MSVKPVRVGPAFQRLILAGDQIWIADAHRATETVCVAQASEKKAFVTEPGAFTETNLYRKLRRVRLCSSEAASHAFWRRKQFEVRAVCHRRAKRGTSPVRIPRNALRSSIP